MLRIIGTLSASDNRFANQSPMLRQEPVPVQPAGAAAGFDYNNRPVNIRPVKAKCRSNVTRMSHKLVTTTNTHMVRLAQYSAAICEAAGILCPAEPMFGLVGNLTMTFMLNAAFCFYIPPICPHVG
jgi:hypothetical protein